MDDDDERTFILGEPNPSPEPKRAYESSTADTSVGDSSSGDGEPVSQSSPKQPPPKQPSIEGAPTLPEVTLALEIGRGGMGVVYKGRQDFLDRDVAVKLLNSGAVKTGSKFERRFKREAKILAGMTHPNIVSCYQAGVTDDGQCYIVMEFIDGPNLRQWCEESGPVTPEQAVEIGKGLARALGHAFESKIIHRDVKPENVLLKRRPNAAADDPFPFEVKLADLGLARTVLDEDSDVQEDDDSMNITAAGAVLGTPSTMSPEQFNDPQEVDHRSDIYGAGCVMFFALAGKGAFQGRTVAEIYSKKLMPQGPQVSELNPSVPKGVCRLISEMLAHEKDNRPGDYTELLSRLEQSLTAKGTSKNGSGRGLAMAGIGVLLAVAIGIPVWNAITGPETGDEPQTGGQKPGTTAGDTQKTPGDPAKVVVDTGDNGETPKGGDPEEKSTENGDSSKGKEPPPPPPPEPKLVLGDLPTTAKEGERVTLAVSCADVPEATEVSYQWRQIGGTGVCSISGAQTAELSFC
ncbi:MAG: protein kinase, partial [Planctomycetota bacterium]